MGEADDADEVVGELSAVASPSIRVEPSCSEREEEVEVSDAD